MIIEPSKDIETVTAKPKPIAATGESAKLSFLKQIREKLAASTILSVSVCFIISNLAVIFLVGLTMHRATLQVAWWVQLMIGTTMLFCSTLIILHLRLHWIGPIKTSRDLLTLIRKGEAPIDELARIKGGISPILEDIQSLLRDLRKQQAAFAHLESETQQRVNNRTNALERSLGAIREQASRDALTGLFNRRVLDSTLTQVVDKCREESQELTIMMIDVDDFKLLNDTLGHAAGDSFLKSLGQLIRSTLRDTDMAFRYGGDEFVILLPVTTTDQAKQVGDRLMSLVEWLTKPLRVARPPRLSIGQISTSQMPGVTGAEALIHEADALLYRIKQERKARRGDKPGQARVA